MIQSLLRLQTASIVLTLPFPEPPSKSIKTQELCARVLLAGTIGNASSLQNLLLHLFQLLCKCLCSEGTSTAEVLPQHLGSTAAGAVSASLSVQGHSRYSPRPVPNVADLSFPIEKTPAYHEIKYNLNLPPNPLQGRRVGHGTKTPTLETLCMFCPL